MTEEVWKITGFNRHPSLLDVLREEVIPIVKNGNPLQIVTVPCSSGAEAIAIAISLEKCGSDYLISGFDVDSGAIRAAVEGEYYVDTVSGQVIGDPYSGYEYQWSNLSQDDRIRFFNESSPNGKTIAKVKPSITSKLRFAISSIELLSQNQYDIIFCLNFLKYLTDPRFSTGLPSLNSVANTLFMSNREVGALMIDPTSDKVESIKSALTCVGYTKICNSVYLKC